MNPVRKIKPWMLKKELIILYYSLKDPRTPLYAKVPAILSIIYLLSPIDLIPDFIPVVGYMDDLVIVPLLLNFSIKLLPARILEDSTLKAMKNRRKLQFVFVLFMALILCLLAGIFLLVKHFFFPGR